MIVLPWIATEPRSPPSEAVSSAVWVALRHPPFGSTNTYTPFNGAPATIVSPEIPTPYYQRNSRHQ